MLPQLRTFLSENWNRLSLPPPRPRNLEFVIQATGVSKLCCYVFGDRSAEPCCVARTMRSPRDNQALAWEYAVIEHLRQHGSEFVRQTVPGPLATIMIAEQLVGIEPFVRGKPMDHQLSASRRLPDPMLPEMLDRGVDWWLRSQQETPSHHGPLSREQLNLYFLSPIDRLRSVARVTPVENLYLKDLARRIQNLSEHPLRLGFCHGDFQLGNILIEGKSVQVIDWEFGAITGLPLMDVFTLLTRLYARCHDLEEIDGDLEDYRTAFDVVFLSGGSFSRMAAEVVGQACDVLGIHRQWTAILLPMFVITEATKYYKFLSQRAGRGYVYLLKDRKGRMADSYVDQLSRQKNVWLLGHLIENESRLAFREAA